MYLQLIHKYYASQEQLQALLLHHSRQVAELAVTLCDMHPQWHADRTFVYEAAMLHDIGIFLCNAPSIHCFGTHPYICHGTLGAELLRKEGLPAHALVAERHTGSGIAQQQIIHNNLPLPHCDFFPQSIEEQVICYADKFFSKSHPERVDSLEHIRSKMQSFGYGSLDRWMQLEHLIRR